MDIFANVIVYIILVIVLVAAFILIYELFVSYRHSENFTVNHTNHTNHASTINDLYTQVISCIGTNQNTYTNIDNELDIDGISSFSIQKPGKLSESFNNNYEIFESYNVNGENQEINYDTWYEHECNNDDLGIPDSDITDANKFKPIETSH
jgi:hypothetical protein